MTLLRRYLIRTLLTVLIVGIAATSALPARADGPLTVRYSAQGRYAVVVGGIGLEGTGAGNIVLNVPGTPVRAYLYWAGFDTLAVGGDSTLRLAVDGNPSPGTERVADVTFGPDFWVYDWYRWLYVEDVTDQVLSGNHTYSISEFNMHQTDGAGLAVVYEDPALPIQNIELRDGQDNFFEGWDPPRGPDSEVACIEFDPLPFDRTMDYYVQVGGVAAVGENRPIALWSQTGTGALPTSLINQPQSNEIAGPPPPYPFSNVDGREWDTYLNAMTIPANDRYACLQIESVADEPNLLGASGVWLALGGSFPVEDTTVLPPPTDVPPTAVPPTAVPPTTIRLRIRHRPRPCRTTSQPPQPAEVVVQAAPAADRPPRRASPPVCHPRAIRPLTPAVG